ncbi:anti-virulence regulator CigR family protein [Rheinheimera sp.]|uniref:anti-virulence regulator CigR family protein n=1 Tax=Rheinheimera sp. TaxID=1869214 RepID=UPI00307F6F06
MNHRIKLWTLLIVPMLGGTAVADPALPAGQSKTKGPAGSPHQGYSPTLVGAGISVNEARQLALEYQLTGEKPLAPGSRNKLRKGKPLPPGLQQRAAPVGFLDRLPVHPGYEWQLLGTDLVLVSVATLIVADVLTDVFR